MALCWSLLPAFSADRHFSGTRKGRREFPKLPREGKGMSPFKDSGDAQLSRHLPRPCLLSLPPFPWGLGLSSLTYQELNSQQVRQGLEIFLGNLPNPLAWGLS